MMTARHVHGVLFILACLVMGQTFAGSYSTSQTSKMSPLCPIGSSEAETLHQTARQYRMGAKGHPVNKAKAEALFEEALAMGNAKSALQLGEMYLSYSDGTRNKYMIAMYVQALKMGCPDAYIALAQCYENGWGVRRDAEKTVEMLRLGAQAGSPKAMEFYGVYLIKQKKETAVGRQWIQRALNAGNGDAGMALASSYISEKNTAEWVRSLRAGASQGSKACLSRLESIYRQGDYGQNVNEPHAACYRKLHDAIEDSDPPKPIPDLDKTCPIQPIAPFRW